MMGSGEFTKLTVQLQPDITFFGEPLPPTFNDRLVNHDRNLVDLVLVIGTSLKVAPVSEVVGYLPANVPQIYISREVSGPDLISGANIRFKADADKTARLVPMLTLTSTCSEIVTSWWRNSVGVQDGN